MSLQPAPSGLKPKYLHPSGHHSGVTMQLPAFMHTAGTTTACCSLFLLRARYGSSARTADYVSSAHAACSISSTRATGSVSSVLAAGFVSSSHAAVKALHAVASTVRAVNTPLLSLSPHPT